MSTDSKLLESLLGVVTGIQASIERCAQDLDRLKKAESVAKGMFGLPSVAPSGKQIADGEATKSHAPTKTVFSMLAKKLGKSETLVKANTYTDMQHESDREKRDVTIGKPENNLPGDRPINKIKAKQGSEPEAVKKEEGMPKAPKAAGAKATPKVALPKAAPETMKTPKAPKAPGAGAMTKNDVPPPPSADPMAGATGGIRPGGRGAMMMSEKGVFAKLKKKVK